MATKTDQELYAIPYDAPLSIAEPSWLWVQKKALEGTNSKILTRQDVPIKNLTGKWVIVTGANSGIGREATLFFAKCGANIVLACRDPPPHEKHPKEVVQECKTIAKAAGHEKATFEWWEIDLTKLKTVEAFTKRWLDTGRALDILCNNAGMGNNPGGLYGLLKTEDGFEFVHQVNFLSHVLIAMRLLPSLARAPEPRIVCTTSCMTYFGKFNLNNWDGTGHKGVEFYSNNKLYYQVWVTELNERLVRSDKYKHITVNGIHPGYVNTGIWQFNTGTGIFGFLTFLVRYLLQLLASFVAVSPEQGSYAIINCATTEETGPNPSIQGVGGPNGKGGGRYFNRIWESENMPHNYDRDCRIRVWRKVNEELKLKEKGLLDVVGV